MTDMALAETERGAPKLNMAMVALGHTPSPSRAFGTHTLALVLFGTHTLDWIDPHQVAAGGYVEEAARICLQFVILDDERADIPQEPE